MSRLLPFLDALERTAWTFIQAFAGTVAALGEINATALKAAGVAAAISAAKSLSVATSVRTGAELAKSGESETGRRRR